MGDDWQHGTTDGIYRWVSISDDGNVEVAADHDGIISKRSRETVITWNELWEKVGNNNDIMDVVKKAIDVANKNID